MDRYHVWMSARSDVLTRPRQPDSIRLGAVASQEVDRLRRLRAELLVSQGEIARELAAVSELIATYTSFDPTLARPEDTRTGSARRRLGPMLKAVLASRSGEWMTLDDIVAELDTSIAAVDMPDLKAFRNALYHLRKSDHSVESQPSDSGIQYRVIRVRTPAQ